MRVELMLKNLTDGNTAAELLLKVQPLVEGEKVRVFLKIPDGVRIIEGAESWEGKIGIKEQKEFSYRLHMSHQKYYLISAVAELHTNFGQVFRGDDFIKLNPELRRELLKDTPVVESDGKKVIRKQGTHIK